MTIETKRNIIIKSKKKNINVPAKLSYIIIGQDTNTFESLIPLCLRSEWAPISAHIGLDQKLKTVNNETIGYIVYIFDVNNVTGYLVLLQCELIYLESKSILDYNCYDISIITIFSLKFLFESYLTNENQL